MKNIAIIGRSEFLYGIMEFLNMNYGIKLIVTSKSPKHYQKNDEDFEKFSNSNDIDFIFTNKINDSKIISKIKKSQIDIAISMNCINTFGPKLIESFKMFALNIHCGDLPSYQGNACPNWAIINGEKKVGLTVHKMIPDKIDEGDYLLKSYYKISSKTYIGDIYKWISYESVKLIDKVFKMISSDNLKWKKMNLNKRIRCYPRKPEDSRIKWYKSAFEIMKLIRSYSFPFQGSYCYLNDFSNKVFILKAKTIKVNFKYFAIPGQIICSNNNNPVIATGNGAIEIDELRINNLSNEKSKIKILKTLRNRLI